MTRSHQSLTRTLTLFAIAMLPSATSSAQAAKPLWSVRADAETPPFGSIGNAFMVGSTVLLADHDAMQIVRIDSTGKVTQRIGRKGSGPGEFTSMFWIGAGPGDSIYVWDGRQRRMSIFSAAGKFVRVESAEHGLQSPVSFGRMRNGKWLVVTRTERALRMNGVDISQSILHVGSSSTIRQAPTQLVEVPSKRFVEITSGTNTEGRELPAMDMSYFAACENGFLVGDGAAREIRAYDENGKLKTTVRALGAPVTTSGAARTALIENWAGVRVGHGAPPSDPKTAAAFAKAFDAAMPRNVMFAEQFAVGGDHSLWLAPSGAAGWQRLGNDGVGKPVLELPKNAWPVAITSQFVLAKWYGDEERVELWRRPAGTNQPADASLSFLGACSSLLVQ